MKQRWNRRGKVTFGCERKTFAGERGLFLEFERLNQNPGALISIVIEERDGHIAGSLFKREVKAERAMQFPGSDAVLETSVKFSNVRTGRDFLEEILAQDLLLGETGKPRLVGVIPEHRSFGIELDDSI